MADKKLYDEKTKTGWKRVEGKWQYFQNGKVADTAMLSNIFTGAQDATKKWAKDTTKKVKDIRQQAIEREESYVPQVMSTHKTPITTALTEEVLPKTWDLTKRGVKNLKNAFYDIPKIGQGSGKFKDGKELSIFELRRQNEKYRNQLQTESLEEIELPEGGDFYSLTLMDNYTGELNSDYNKVWAGVDTSNFDAYQNLNFKNSMSETYSLTEAVNGPTYSIQTKENSYINLAKSNNPTQLGGTQPNDTAALAKGAGLKTENTIKPGSTQWVGKNTTWVDRNNNVIAPKVDSKETVEAPKEDPKVTQWYDIEGEDGGAAAKALWKENNQPEQVKIDPIEFKDPVQSSLLFGDLQPETAINPLRNA